MEDRMDQAKEIVKNMNKDLDLSKIEEMIKDNKIEFEHKDKVYRIRLLNLKEKEELDTLRRKKFGQLIQDKDILLEKDLIKVLKGREIDIEEMNDKIRKLEAEEEVNQVSLGDAIAKNMSESVFKPYKDKIIELRLEKQMLSTQKTLLLEYSLENQLLNYTASIVTYLSLDKLEDGEWKHMFNNLEEFQTYPDEELINKSASYSIMLQYL